MNVPKIFFIITVKELSEKNIWIGGKTLDRVKEEYLNNQQ